MRGGRPSVHGVGRHGSLMRSGHGLAARVMDLGRGDLQGHVKVVPMGRVLRMRTPRA